MSQSCTMTFYTEKRDMFGMPEQWHHYLVVISPAPIGGFHIASRLSLTGPRVYGDDQPLTAAVLFKGTAQAAFDHLEAELDEHHPGLSKIMSIIK
jgi:hypothetical protein